MTSIRITPALSPSTARCGLGTYTRTRSISQTRNIYRDLFCSSGILSFFAIYISVPVILRRVKTFSTEVFATELTRTLFGGLRGLLALSTLDKRKRNVAVALVVLQVHMSMYACFIRRVSHSRFLELYLQQQHVCCWLVGCLTSFHPVTRQAGAD